MKRQIKVFLVVCGILLVASVFSPKDSGVFSLMVPFVFAHCDSMEGPMIPELKKALSDGNIIPVLKWVKKEHEQEITDLFNKTIKVSKLGKEAKEIAEMNFLETVVRIHRADEGASYTGIKPAGTPMDAAVVKGDKSLETGSVDALANLLSGKIKKKIQEGFKKALALKPKANKDVETGREYVEAYVNYIHFVENLHKLIKHSGHAHGEKKHDH